MSYPSEIDVRPTGCEGPKRKETDSKRIAARQLHK